MTGRLCTFAVGDVLLGVELEHVLEISRDDAVTPVPLAPASVAGVLNLRGRIVTAVDASQRLGLPHVADARVTVLISCHGEGVGLLVEREGDVVDVDPSMAVDQPATAGDTLRSFTTSTYQLDDALVFVLDPDTTLSMAST